MDYGAFTLVELKNGYRYDTAKRTYICNYCDCVFPEGQVFTISGNLFYADAAAGKHIETAHNGSFSQLLQADSKYNTLTEHQAAFLSLFHAGLPDKEIASRLNVSLSTVRHQKFTFREKAKQAKLLLALFEIAFGDKPDNEESIVPIHEHATFYDDRYVITEQEKNHILESEFYSLEPLRLKIFPRKEKKKVVILTKIAEQFETGRTYAEKEVNVVLKEIFDDFTALRRYLIMYGFMDREADGSKYWRK